MATEEQQKDLMDALSAAYSDPKVKKDKELQNMIYEFAKEVNTSKNIAHSCVLFVPKMNALVSINAFHIKNIPMLFLGLILQPLLNHTVILKPYLRNFQMLL